MKPPSSSHPPFLLKNNLYYKKKSFLVTKKWLPPFVNKKEQKINFLWDLQNPTKNEDNIKKSKLFLVKNQILHMR